MMTQTCIPRFMITLDDPGLVQLWAQVQEDLEAIEIVITKWKHKTNEKIRDWKYIKY